MIVRVELAARPAALHRLVQRPRHPRVRFGHLALHHQDVVDRREGCLPPHVDDGIPRVDRNVQVAPIVVELTELLPHIADELRARLAGRHEQIEKEQWEGFMERLKQ